MELKILFTIYCITLLISGAFGRPQTESNNTDSGISPTENVIGGIIGGLFGLLGQAGQVIGELSRSEQVSEVVDTFMEIGENATHTAIDVGSNLLENTPAVISEGSSIITGLIRATNETRPMLEDGITEYFKQMRLFSSFLRIYSGIVAENVTGMTEHFVRRLRCNINCQQIEETTKEREDCEMKYCEDLKKNDNTENIKEIS